MDIQIEQKGPVSKKYIPFIIGGCALAALALWGFFADHSRCYRVDANSVIIGKAQYDQFNDYVRLNGKVEPGMTVQLPALESGVVERIEAQEGQMVHQGDVIMVLGNPNLRQQILDSEAQLAEKQNMLRDTEISMEKERLSMQQDLLSIRTEYVRARRAYQQQKALYDERLTSHDEFLKAEEDFHLIDSRLSLLRQRIEQDSIYRGVQVAMLRDNLSNMMLNLQLVRSRADNLVIRASYDGQLGNLQVNEQEIMLGQNIMAGQSVGQINILDSYRIHVNVDEHYIDRVSPGLVGSFERAGNNYDVSVQKVYPEVNGGKFRCDLVFTSEQPDNVRVGQTYYINLQLGESSNSIIIPRGSFFQTTGGQWLYVLNADGTEAVKRQVKIGRQNPQYYEVVEGLNDGERVIISSYESFGDAEKIILE
ncbi:MAG: biotin/lipoyl-binding protein [Bacteroidales bacterium]|nr:biotin/lipoyl-binding protein [Bacteroidales bacterium]